MGSSKFNVHQGSHLERQLRQNLRGDVMFDDFSRGRYATDASIYQIFPKGVVVPADDDDIATALAIAREFGVTVLPRGSGTSQCGQTVADALVIDTSKYCNTIHAVDVENRRVEVQPGIVLDRLNQDLAQHGLFFPIDPSTASRATIGGMVGNNSCGARTIKYGNTVHNVHAVDAILANGKHHRFTETSADLDELDDNAELTAIVHRLRAIAARERDELLAHWPKVIRNVAGYNLDSIDPKGHNLAKILVGSEGTLAFFKRVTLDLQPIPRHKVLGVCRFRTFYAAMNNTQHLVQLNPTAVELVDRTMIDLALEIPAFKPVVETLVDDTTDALLLVEFAGDDPTELRRGLDRLEALMTDIDHHGQVIRVEDGRGQQNIWNVRKAGLNIMMSMKGDGKPISFIEDCAVPLDHLADYTSRLNDIFAKYGTKGTWYAHASVGCLHVRPVLNVKNELDVKKMRAIAEETFAMVREYKGSHSGEHGDGIVRSEFHEPMLGRRIVAALEEVKDVFDPDGFFNPGRIVRAPKMDDRALFRYFPQYQPARIDTALNWSDWGGFSGAVEMCNNNGACRKSNGVMCPSFQATGDEMHLTRGRANSLRLALTGQLPAASLISEAMKDTMALCVSCKGCKRECPTGVDMARMKIEFMHHYRKTHAASYRDRLVAWMPRYAHRAAPLSWLIHARNHSALLRRLGQKILGINANRSLMPWHKSFLARTAADAANMTRGVGQPAKHVALFVDTFTNTLESEHAAAAVRVLAAAGYSVEIIGAGESRPYCCGRTFLTQGFVDEAKHELHRLLDATKKLTAENVPIIGLEPSCILGLKDECVALVDDPAMKQLANSVTLFEEFVAAESQAGRFSLDLRPAGDARALLHGHCHQKAFDVMTHIESTLQLIPQLEVETIDSGCCGMAGAFGYEAEHHEVSIAMAERTLLPKIREADAETYIVAGGTSCRHQIKDGTSRTALHPASLLDKFLA